MPFAYCLDLFRPCLACGGVRVLLVCLLILSALGTSPVEASQKSSAAVQPTVYLDLQKQDTNVRVPGVLIRELFRQAFLIAAREEFGARTRDASLGEPLPALKDKDVPVFNIHVTITRRGRYVVQVMQRDGEKLKLIEKRDLKLTNRSSATEAVQLAEEYSRTWFKDLLQQAGYVPQKKKATKEAIPTEPLRFIKVDDLNFRQQYGQLIDAHAAIAKQGESPALLAQLARSYALFGTLTEQYWSLIPLATKARGLLYAERLQQKHPDSAYALSNRALVRGLLGLDRMALKDIETIAGLKSQTNVPAEWLPVVEAHCRYDNRKLKDQKLTPENELLRDYLALLQVTYFGTPQQQNDIADTLQVRDIHSVRAFYTRPRTLDDRQSLAIIHDVNFKLIQFCQPYLKGKNVRKLLPEFAGTRLQNLVESRDALVAVLKDRGMDPAEKTEPSFSMLASTVQDLTMLQAWDLVSRRQELRSVNADQELNLFLKSLDKHPFKPFLQTFGWQQAIALEAFNELGQVPGEYWTTATHQILARDRKIGLPNEPLETVRDTTYIRNGSHVISELAFVIDYAVPEEEKPQWVPHLTAVSPDSPYTIIQELTFNWKQNEPRVPELLKRYADVDQLTHAIAYQYSLRFDYPRAETIYQQVFNQRPTYENIYPLIKMAQLQGKDEQELRLRNEALALVQSVMERAGVEAEIARYYIKKKDYKEALKHAKVAAKTYSGWGLRLEAECHELLGDLDSALELRKQEAVRYNNQFDFHTWCRSRGLEPPAEIQTFLKPYVDYYSKVPLSDDRYLVSDQLMYKQLSVVGCYQYLEGNPQAAMKVWGYTADEYHFVAEAFPAIMAALIADELGMTKERDEYLSQALDIEFLSRGKKYHLPQLNQILLCKRILTGKDAQALSPEVIDWYLQEPESHQARIFYQYFVGKALLQKKQNKLAIRYLQQAAESEEMTGLLAAAVLRKLKHKPEPVETQAAEQSTTDLHELLDQVYAYEYHKRRELQLVTLNRAAELFPESSLVFIRRGKLQALLKQRDRARQDFDKAIELTPEVPEVWISRGEYLESTGQDQAAVKDFEEVVQRDPQNSFAPQAAAKLLASSPDDKVRDGKRALEYAQQATRLIPEQKSLNMALLAAAYAELGQFDKAKEYNQNAIKYEQNYRSKKSYQNRQKLYDAGKPYRLKKRS